MSPQILKRENYTSKCDIWSIGLIMYELLYGTTPWPSHNVVELVSKLFNNPLKFPEFPVVSEETKTFISNCLFLEEENRISWE